MSDDKRPVSRDAVEKTARQLQKQSQQSGRAVSFDACKERAARVARKTNFKRRG